jgi:AmiR/NasT family two-component response regulator
MLRSHLSGVMIGEEHIDSGSLCIVHSLLIVDDNALIRRQLRQVFDGQSDFHVCGEAENGRKAVQVAEELIPDALIMDLYNACDEWP